MAGTVFDLMASLTMDSSQFNRELTAAQKKINKFSSGMGSIGKGLTSIGSTLTNKITKPALIAGGALAGITLAKGWMRMTEIDTAKVKLEAIGLSAQEVEKVSNASLESVKGTAYGMAEAMTTAASATAAGIKPGIELQKYLTNVADAAAVAGIGMDEMGAIFNKVATQNKATNEVLQQVAERGIPIYQWLAEETGHTAEEIFEMASKGEIDLATFQAAVENHIGGAAKEIGSKTITGAISNISAAISRLGAAFLGSADNSNTFAGKLLPILNDVTGWIDGLTEKVEPMGATFGQVFGAIYNYLKNGSVAWQGMNDSARSAFEKIQPILDTVKNAATWFSDLGLKGQIAFAGLSIGAGPAIQIIGKVFTAFSNLSGIIGKLPGGFTKFLGPIGLAVAAFALLWAKSEEFRNAVISLVTSLTSALAPVFDALMPLLTQVGGLLGELAQVIGPVLGAALEVTVPLISGLGKAFTAIVAPMIEAASGMVVAIRKPISAVVSMKNSIVNGFRGAKDKAISYMQGLKDGIKDKIDSAKTAVKGAIDKIKGYFPLKVGKILGGIKLPHFKVTGSPPFGLGGKGKKPSISVSWYRKAEQNPYLFSNATLFGAGEGSQDELLYGKNNLMKDIKDAVGNTGSIVINLNYNAGDDAQDMLRDLARGIRRYRMAGAF